VRFQKQRKGTSKCTPFCNGKNMQKHLKYASRRNYLLHILTFCKIFEPFAKFPNLAFSPQKTAQQRRCFEVEYCICAEFCRKQSFPTICNK